MASIGTVKLQKDGSYVGTLKTLSVEAPISITPVKGKASDKHPDFNITSKGVEVGAGWKRNGKRSGKDYVSCQIEAPELGAKTLYFNLGKAADSEDPDAFNLIWNAQ